MLPIIVTLLALLVILVIILRREAWMQRALLWLWSVRAEWLGLPVAAALFFLSPAVLRSIEPNAATFDVGVLQVLFVGAIQLLVAHTTANILAAISYRRLFKFNPNETFACRLWYVALYALYLLCMVVLLAAL